MDLSPGLVAGPKPDQMGDLATNRYSDELVHRLSLSRSQPVFRDGSLVAGGGSQVKEPEWLLLQPQLRSTAGATSGGRSRAPRARPGAERRE